MSEPKIEDVKPDFNQEQILWEKIYTYKGISYKISLKRHLSNYKQLHEEHFFSAEYCSKLIELIYQEYAGNEWHSTFHASNYFDWCFAGAERELSNIINKMKDEIDYFLTFKERILNLLEIYIKSIVQEQAESRYYERRKLQPNSL